MTHNLVAVVGTEKSSFGGIGLLLSGRESPISLQTSLCSLFSMNTSSCMQTAKMLFGVSGTAPSTTSIRHRLAHLLLSRNPKADMGRGASAATTVWVLNASAGEHRDGIASNDGEGRGCRDWWLLWVRAPVSWTLPQPKNTHHEFKHRLPGSQPSRVGAVCKRHLLGFSRKLQ